MEPENRDDWGDDVRRRIAEAKAMAEDRAEDFKDEVQDSKAYKGWKSWSSSQRFWAVAIPIILLALILGLVSQISDVPWNTNPGGE